MKNSKNSVSTVNAKNAKAVKNNVAIESANKVPTFENLSKAQKSEYLKSVSEFKVTLKSEIFSVSQWIKFLVTEKVNDKNFQNIIAIRFGLTDLSDVNNLRKVLINACLKGFKYYSPEGEILQPKFKTVWIDNLNYQKISWYEIKTLYTFSEVYTAIFKPAKNAETVADFATQKMQNFKASVTSGKVSADVKTVKKAAKKTA